MKERDLTEIQAQVGISLCLLSLPLGSPAMRVEGLRELTPQAWKSQGFHWGRRRQRPGVSKSG